MEKRQSKSERAKCTKYTEYTVPLQMHESDSVYSVETARKKDEVVMSYSTPLKEIRSCDKPREKMYQLGADKLTDTELLAILLRTGTRGKNVLELAKDLLHEYGNLSALTRASLEELQNFKGIGKVKALELSAALEITSRVLRNPKGDNPLLAGPEQIAELLYSYVIDEDKDIERFFVLPVDKKCRLCGPVKVITRGILDSSLVHPREVFKQALRYSAASIIVSHNHPSGDATPSKYDVEVTNCLIEAGKTMSIPLLDHLIVTDQFKTNPDGTRTLVFYSMRRSGLMTFET